MRSRFNQKNLKLFLTTKLGSKVQKLWGVNHPLDYDLFDSKQAEHP